MPNNSNGPEVIKLFSSSTEHEISTAQKLKYQKVKKFLALSLSDVVFIMLINVKMPTMVGILTFMSRVNLVSAELSMKKSFITSGPVLRSTVAVGGG